MKFPLQNYEYHVSYRTWANYEGDRECWGDGIFFLNEKLSNNTIVELRKYIADHIKDDIGKIQILSVYRCN